MTQPSPTAGSAQLSIIETLAYALERVERGFSSVSPRQYQQLTARLSQALRTVGPGVALQPLLDSFPAMAELYENVNYERAGLCRSPLQASSDAEVMARTIVARARCAEDC
ncbi:hypothetical protein [Aquabacterium sp.]|uniref:hypothetical protein n=1 Tax=Aquabacterium sp. TaxID=1872578 RepID=UPI003D6CE891